MRGGPLVPEVVQVIVPVSVVQLGLPIRGGAAGLEERADMCVDFEPDFSFTENICEFCKPGDDQDHDDCNYYVEEACACRNSDHTLADPVAFQARFYEEFAKAKEAMRSAS